MYVCVRVPAVLVNDGMVEKGGWSLILLDGRQKVRGHSGFGSFVIL